MKKIILLGLLAVLLLSACSSSAGDSDEAVDKGAKTEAAEVIPTVVDDKEEKAEATEVPSTSRITQLEEENAKLKEEIKAVRENEGYRGRHFHTLINLSFTIFTAMNNRDYDILESLSTSNVIYDREKHEMTLTSKGNPFTVSVNNNYNFDTIDYSGFHYEGDKAILFLISYPEGFEGHVSFEMHFIKTDEGWKFDYYVS